MKLKLVVASMGLLGLMSSPAYAHTPAKASVSNFDHVLVQANQNVGRASGRGASWSQFIHVHGGMNVDTHWGSRWGQYVANAATVTSGDRGWTGMDGKAISINDLYLSLFTRINSWTEARMSFDYFTPSNSWNRVERENRYNTGLSHTFLVDQAYVTMGNMNCWPFYMQIGKSYLPFGEYKLHPMVKPFTQVLSQTNIENVQFGWVTRWGLSAGLWVYESALSPTSVAQNPPSNPIAYGLYAKYMGHMNAIRYDFGASWTNSMNDVNTIKAKITTSGNNVDSGTQYVNRVTGLTAHANMYVGPFDFHVHYVTALDRFSDTELNYVSGLAEGAKPWAVSLNAGYSFYMPVFNKLTHAYVGFERSGQASALNLPVTRWSLGANVDAMKNFLLGLDVTNNVSYRVSKTNWRGNDWINRKYTTLTVRFGVKF